VLGFIWRNLIFSKHCIPTHAGRFLSSATKQYTG